MPALTRLTLAIHNCCDDFGTNLSVALKPMFVLDICTTLVFVIPRGLSVLDKVNDKYGYTVQNVSSRSLKSLK